MVAPSYVGPTVTAQCPSCGCFAEIPEPENGFGPVGNCTGPESGEPCGIVRWVVWDGPVAPI